MTMPQSHIDHTLIDDLQKKDVFIRCFIDAEIKISKLLSFKASYSLFLCAILTLLPFELWGKAILFYLEPNVCTEQILIGKNQRITLAFPKKLKLAIPERDQSLSISLKEHIAVVSLVQAVQPEQNQSIAIQFVMENQSIFSCRFYPQAEILEENMVDLIEIKPNPPKLRDDKSDVNQLLDHLEKEQVEAYLNRIDQKSKEWLLKKSNQALIKIHPFNPKRAQQHFIYLKLYQIIELGDELILQLTISNRSQPSFEIIRVNAITRTKEMNLPFQVQQTKIPANEQEYKLSTMINARLSDLIEIQVCDQSHCVSIDLLSEGD